MPNLKILMRFRSRQKEKEGKQEDASQIEECPYCGSRPEIICKQYSDRVPDYFIQCPKCRARSSVAYSLERVIQRWNSVAKGGGAVEKQI